MDNINLSNAPSIPAAPPNRRPFKRFGFVLIFVAVIIFGGMVWWGNSRIYFPFRGTVSLKPGHTRTPDFLMNFHADYLLFIAHDNGKCNWGVSGGPQVHWRLLKSRLVVADGWDEGCWVNGSFQADSGVYYLDLEVLPRDSRPIEGSAEVEIVTSPDRGRVYGFSAEPLDSLICVLFLVFFLAGLFGVFHTRADRLEDFSINPDRGAQPRGIAITFYSTRQAHRRRPKLISPFSLLRAYSYVVLYVVLVPWIIFVISSPPQPMGLKVNIPEIGKLSPSRDPWNAPRMVRIDASGHMYLNREPMPVADVYPRLRAQWSLLGDQTVYLDADPEVDAGAVIVAVGEIQQATRASVVLVTPSMKKEAPWLNWTSPCERKELYSGVLKPAPIWNDRMAYRSPYSTLIQFDIDERGDVSHVGIAKPSTRPARDAALVRWVKKQKFQALPGCEIDHFFLER
jgi:biopolymer transport protein ExbD